MPSPTRISLVEIARKAGVSRMAVSLALRGRAGVSEKTRRKVLHIAQKLGYQADPELSKLLSHIRGRTPAETRACLGLLTSGQHPHDWQRSVTERKYVEGARERAKTYGYRMDEFWINEPGMTEARLGNIMWNRGIEGIVIAPLQEKLIGRQSHSLRLDFNLFSAVEISETIEWPDLDRSNHDQYTSMLKCLGELVDLNYQKIGFVLESSLDLRVNGKWTAAYLQYRHRFDSRKLAPPLILDGPKQSTFDRWFDQHHPDVVISVDGIGLRLIQERGLNIPGEVSYATLDWDELGSDQVHFSGIDQNSHLVGAAAVDMLVSAIQRGQRGIPAQPVRMEIEGTWKSGASTPRRP